MSSTYRSITADIELEIRSAFASFRDQSIESGVFIFRHDSRPSVQLVDVIAEEIARTPTLTRLLLVHPSPSIGFLSSSIGLRAGGRVRVNSAASLETASVGERPPISARTAGRFDVVTIAADDDVVALLTHRLGGLKERGRSGIAVVFASESRPSTSLVDTISAALERDPFLAHLALVHPSPSLGFLASAIGLRLPRVRVRAYHSLDELSALGDMA